MARLRGLAEPPARAQAAAAACLGGRQPCGIPWVEPALRVRGRLSTHMQKENLMRFPKAMRTPDVMVVADLRLAFGRIRDVLPAPAHRRNGGGALP